MKVQSGGYKLVPIGAPATDPNTRGWPAWYKKDWFKIKTTWKDPSAFEYNTT